MQIKFCPNKNILLKEQRGISFDDIIDAIADDRLLQIRSHPNPDKYPHQKILLVDIEGEVYVIPYVEESDDAIFFKTAYPSRKAKKFLVD